MSNENKTPAELLKFATDELKKRLREEKARQGKDASFLDEPKSEEK